MGDFLESFIWSSMDHPKDNFKNNYLIFKDNYFIFLKNNYFVFPIYFLNHYLPPFLNNYFHFVVISLFSPIHQYGYEKTN
jgi:hypothetical protein